MGVAGKTAVGIGAILGAIFVAFYFGMISMDSINPIVDEIKEKTAPFSKTVENTTGTIKDVAEKTTTKIKEAAESTTTTIKETTEKELPKIKIQPPPILNPFPAPDKSIDDLREHALELINKDRSDHGVPPVKISSNFAAQAHAEDLLQSGIISHWMTNGEKPYMTYTRYNGTGYVGQNVASAYCEGLGCRFDAQEQIKNGEYSMMYDDADSNWGHRDNIINPTHTHVSIGIAFTNNKFFYVQNFEKNYIEFEKPMFSTENKISIAGNLTKGSLLNVAVHHDPTPTPSLYNQHKNDGFYELGELIAIVEKPLPPGWFYDDPTNYKLVIADKWSEKNNSIEVDFDISKIISSPGAYTVVIWIDDDGTNIPVTSYTVFAK